MADETFNETILTEKLSKLNSSQQSIESLSRWCISHRKKAKQVVETWDKLFKSAKHEQRVSLLYLSNDILQNSRRKGSEFVNEFWKVLPAALKGVYENGNESCRKVASRLVDIWEERKVFGSRGQNLKNEMLGKNPSPVPVNNGKFSNPIKVVKRDATSLRIKLAVGGLPEKILTALQLVHDEAVNEDAALDKFHNAVSYVREMEKDVLYASSQGNLSGSDVVDNIEKQETMIKQCISELEKSEAVRVALVSQLKEALQDQELKLEQIRSEILAGRGQIEQAANIRLQLTSNSSAPPPMNQLKVEPTFSPAMPTSNVSVPPPANPLTSFANSTEEDNKKATAAAVAAKLAASTSSAQMLTSILSSLVAEEAASMSSGLKRPKLEPPMSFSDAKNTEGANSTYFPTSQQAMTSMPPVQSGSTQSISQVNQLQAPFLPPPPPPPPLAPPGNSPPNQLVQSNMMGLPYGYGATNLLPPPLASNAPTGFARPGPPPQQTQPQQLQNQQPQQLQPPASGGYYRPVGIGFYGQSHQPPTPPIHRQ